MKKIFVFFLALCSLLVAPSAFAIDLMEVYLQSLGCDPTFKGAQSTYLAAKENVPIARAALLPNINVTGSVNHQRIDQSGSDNVLTISAKYSNTISQYALNLSQPIFNYPSWVSLKMANNQSKQAAATFSYAAQNLMFRVSQAYFGVLSANDNLRYTTMQKNAVAKQLKQAKEQYEVGLIAVTAYDNARASYDSIVASEIAAKAQLANAVEQLRTITNNTYPVMAGITSQVPLVSPKPANIEQWVAVSERQNYNLLASLYASEAARDNVKVKAGQHLPVITANGQYFYDRETNNGGFGFFRQHVIESGISASMPVYQGGLITSQTRQADRQYQQAVSSLELAHRTIVAQTRNTFIAVYADISKIEADRQAVISNQTALRSTLASYSVGTRTMVDVLNAQSALYQSAKVYSADQYTYMLDTLNLKFNAGTLSADDLAKINAWLNANIRIVITTPGAAAAYPNMTPEANPPLRKISGPIEIKEAQLPKPKPIKKEILAMKAAAARKPLPMVVTNDQEILNLDPQHYTIQLLSAKEKAQAVSFIRNHHLQGKAIYFEQVRADKVRYPIIYGDYATVAEATAAAKSLPVTLRELNPSIRKYSNIQAEIAK